MLIWVLTAVHVVIAVFLTLIVLVQSGKGADIGSAFGGGASQTMFGPRGATTVLHKITAGLAAGFMVTSLVLAIMVGHRRSESVIRDEPATPAPPASQPAGTPAGDQKAPSGAAAPGAQSAPAPAAPAAPGSNPRKAAPPPKTGEPTKR
jgi:preprotein translocase subunit SecG